MYTLPVGLSAFIGIHGTLWNQLMAASLLCMIPLVVVFFFGQSALVTGGRRTMGLTGCVERPPGVRRQSWPIRSSSSTSATPS